MRFVFIDEAGTSDSPDERGCVVAGLIGNADTHIFLAEHLITEAMSMIPSQFRNGFIFHSEEIMNSKRYRECWRLTDRVKFLCTLMSIPRRIGIAISYGQIWSEFPSSDPVIMPADLRHMLAFDNCISKADQFIREHCGPNEIGTIVAERNDIQQKLSNVLRLRREHAIVFSPEMLEWRDKDTLQGYNSQAGVMKVSRIRKTIHYVSKEEDKMVWLADAIAYGLKRYFSELKFGSEFGHAIHNDSLNLDDHKRCQGTAGLLIPRSE